MTVEQTALLVLGVGLGIIFGMAMTEAMIRKKPRKTKKGTYYYITKENEPKNEDTNA